MKFAIALFLISTSTWASECVNAQLIDQGFSWANAKEFHVIKKNVETWMKKNQDDFVADYKSPMYSSVYKGFVTVASYDNLQTPQAEMYGDVILISDYQTNELLEVRWYQNDLKLFAFNTKKQNCPTAVVPVADNALF